jgi:hypothetical protein
MTTFNKTLSTTTAVRNVDPRIDSPQIKVIYPSLPTELASQKEGDPVTSTAPPQVPHAPALPVFSSENRAVENKAVETTNEVTFPTKIELSPTVKTWTEVLRQNATLFILVSLISVVVGIFIGKKL